MDTNPYLPPSLTAGAVEPMDPPRPVRRPTGIALLAGLLALLGLVLLLLLPVILWAGDNAQWSARTGVPIALLLTLGAFAAAMFLATAVGLWFGKPWAWWLAAWYYVSGVLGNAFQLLSIPVFLQTGRYASFEEPLLKHSVRLAFDLSIVLYLFRPHVKQFFGLQAIRPWRTVTIMAGITLVLGTALAGIVAYNLISARRAERAAESRQEEEGDRGQETGVRRQDVSGGSATGGAAAQDGASHASP